MDDWMVWKETKRERIRLNVEEEEELRERKGEKREWRMRQGSLYMLVKFISKFLPFSIK